MSSRNTWTVFDVDMHTGAVIWRIGGKHPTFKPGRGTVFRFQHDATWQPGGLVSVFDNGYSVAGDTQSRGLLLKPDLATDTVTLVKQFINPYEKILTQSQGDLLKPPRRRLADGLRGSSELHRVRQRRPRAARRHARHQRGELPDLPRALAWRADDAAERRGPDCRHGFGRSRGELERRHRGLPWRLLAGTSPGSLSPVATVARAGFETTAMIPAAQFVAVAALGGSGQLLATSKAITPAG